MAAGETGKPAGNEEYVPGSFLRDHIAARRGAHAADVVRKRRKKTHSIPVLVGILALIILIIWMMYFK